MLTPVDKAVAKLHVLVISSRTGWRLLVSPCQYSAYPTRQVRAFTDKRGKRILWASMCDSISQLDADAVATSTAPAATRHGDTRATRDTVGGVRIPAATRKHRRSLEPPAAAGETVSVCPVTASA